MLNWPEKISLKILLAIFILSSVFGAMIFDIVPAKAQYHDYVGWSGYYKAQNSKEEIEKKKKEVEEALLKNKNYMVMNAVINAMSYFANKISYDMAVWLASGGKGQAPFSSTSGFFKYLGNVAGDSLGESLGSLGESMGLNLCDLPNPQLDLAFQLGLNFQYAEPEPKCTWKDLKKNFSAENFKSKYMTKEGTLGRLNASVEVKSTDFGIWTDAKAKIDGIAIQKEEAAKADREEGSGMKAMTDLISGQIETPADVMSYEMRSQAASSKMTKEEAKKTGEVWGAFGAGAKQIALKTASTFISTMLGTVLKNFMEGGMLPGGYKVCNPGLSITGINLEPCSSDSSGGGTVADSYYADTKNTDNRAAAQAMFSELLVPAIKTLDNYDLISNLAECSPENLSPESCVVDQSFLQILQAGDSGELLTVKQAMEKGWLHGDWKMISSFDTAASQKWDCSQSAYCQRNMTFLRRARILPVGFEFAALISPVAAPVSLKEVVDNFYTVASPYYHLINPHWVIKAPKIRCKAFTFSSIAQNGARLEECSDLQHCVGYNKDGSCQTWGYCTKERAIWKFSANYCDAQYSTCRAFTDSEGNDAGYLMRTLDTASCGEDNDGCRRYSSSKVYTSATTSIWMTEMISYYFGSHSDHYFYNSSAYFNKKVTTCDAADDGCSAFKLADNPDTLLYLRKAPDYLGCYDADVKPIPYKVYDGINWPENLTELSLINPQNKEACDSYAQVCLPEEESCNLYTATLSQEEIPGKFKPAEVVDSQLVWNDQCDSSCAGYAAYREMPGNYTNGTELAYIVPSSGKTCSSQDAGCSAFTNLNIASDSGMEQTEYFSYLRPCILPDQTKQKTFYLYESAESGGYKLQTFVLEKAADGSPKQIWRDPSEVEMFGDCDLLSYGGGTADPDCHQFNDDVGNTYYRYLSKTILVSEVCNPYRLNNTELVDGQCPFDFDGAGNRVGNAVEQKDGACYYSGLPTGDTRGAGETASCSATVNSCRAYKGNAGNNVRAVFEDKFEDDEMDNWIGGSGGSIEISLESNQINGHSLKNFGRNGFGRVNIEVLKGKSYVLTFWAKGNTSISPLFKQAKGSGLTYNLNFGDPVTLTDVWHYYSFGPLEFSQTDTSTFLYFVIPGADLKNVFIDNIKLMEITDYIYLIKNSLSVPAICDSNLTDNMPGEALGCTAYKDPSNNTYYLTNFSYLCREAAVGCTALLNTYNTLETDKPRAYNVWLSGDLLSDDERSAEAIINGQTFSCVVPTGAAGCYIDIAGNNLDDIVDVTGSSALTSSTVYIPGDTPTSSPIYLVANKEATCKSENIGCQVVGKSAIGQAGVFNPLAIEYEDVAVKNDPALFEDILCGSESVGCRAYTSGDSQYYFKDPKVIGQKVCAYSAAKTTATGPMVMGWYWKDTKMCGDASGFCTTDSDCPTSVMCLNIPCYPLYYKFNDVHGAYEWGLWSFGNTKYNGFAGECPTEQSGCTEFIDHSSSAQTGGKSCAFSGKKCEVDSDCNEVDNDYCKDNVSGAYYLLDNQVLTESKNKCNGMVSQAEGCILLDQTSMPNKYWHTTSTYQASQTAGDAFVTPVDVAVQNDANIILKVSHDRECEEWGYCDLKQDYTDEDSGETTSRCYHLGVCTEATGSSIFNKECMVPNPDFEDKSQTLTLDYYKSREAYWDSLDYSGYSIPWMYSIADVTARKLADDNYHLVHVDYTEAALGDCSMTSGVYANCGIEINGQYGKCFYGECLRSPNNMDVPENNWTGLGCRGNPEVSSPFPNEVLTEESENLDYKIFKEGFEGVNLCYNKNGNSTDCVCSYKKLKTSADVVYTPASQSLAGSYVCSGGTEQGRFCNGKDDITTCGADGICAAIQSLSAMTGWQGYCMEGDPRQFVNGWNVPNCLTWWPIEVPPGTTNIWDIDESAGYQIAEGNKDRFMCLINEPIIYQPEKMIGIQTGSEHWDDFHIQSFPKNYKIDKWNTTGLGLINLKQNMAVSGCADNNPDEGTTGDGGDVVYNYDLTDVDGDGYNSTGKFCPINRDTLVKDYSDTMYECTNADTTWDEDSQSYNCPNSGDHIWSDTGLSGQYWTKKSMYDATEYFHRNEIERIDVFFDDVGTEMYSDGWISFITDSIDAEESHSFKVVENFINKDGSSAWYGVTDNSQMKCTDDDDWPGETGDLKAWEWRGGYGTPDWDIAASADSSISKHKILTQGVCKNLYKKVIVDNLSADKQSIAVRVIWDGDYHLRGIWLNSEAVLADHPNIGFFFVIHFNNGRCEKFAKVSSASGEFPFKPVTSNLASGATIGMTGEFEELGLTIESRVPELNGGNYGLAWGEEDGYMNPEDRDEAFVNPFMPWPNTSILNTIDYSQGGSYLLNYEITSFRAGVPLVFARYGKVKDIDWEEDSSYPEYNRTHFNSTALESLNSPWKSFLNNMYVKVYGQYENKSTEIDGVPYPDGFELISGTEFDGAKPYQADQADVTIYPPHVAAPIPATDLLAETWELDAISVNDQVEGNIYLVSGGQAHIKFFAWAHGRQMPLRRIIVAKGDGITINQSSVAFGNRKFKCAGNTCGSGGGSGQFACETVEDCEPLAELQALPTGTGITGADHDTCSDNEIFGNTSDTGCHEGPYDYVTDFNCPYGESVWVENGNQAGGDDCDLVDCSSDNYIDWNTIQNKYGAITGVCVVRPKVQITDNWGWCNGTCSASYTSPNNIQQDGCYEDYDNNGSDPGDVGDCSDSENAWTRYDGNIIIIPTI